MKSSPHKGIKPLQIYLIINTIVLIIRYIYRGKTMAYSVEASTGKIIEDEKDHSGRQLLCVEK